MARHVHGKPLAEPMKLASLTSVNGVLDINSTAYTEGPADFVRVLNTLGSVQYDPDGPIFRLDQPTNAGLPFPPSPFIGNVPSLTKSDAASTDDLRIVVPLVPGDTSATALYDTTAIFGASISFFPTNSWMTDELGNPITKPMYVVALS